MKIIPLSEGRFTIDASKEFIPFDSSLHNLSDRSRGSLLVEIQPFVVVTASDIILFDTGLGFRGPDGILQIHSNLLAAGIHPENVSMVLMSHLHKDHAGGILNHSKPAFPFARYVINRNEWEYAHQKGAPSYEIALFSQLDSLTTIHWIEASGRVNDCVRYETSGGHCLHHTVFWLRENDDEVFFGGDVAPQLQQMKTRYITKYDENGRLSMELRRKWWAEGAEKNWRFMFYHDIAHPVVDIKGI